MPKSPDTSSIVKTKAQTSVTIPKPISDAFNLEAGQKVKWRILGKGKLELTVLLNKP